jgi:hypothetical protein
VTKEFRNITWISWTTLVLFTTPAGGQIFPFDRTDIHTGTGPQRVAVGDFNNDGISDIAALNYTEGSVSILLGNGDGTFQSPKTTALGTFPRELVIADFNRDGKMDLAGNDQDGNRVYVLIGKGDGTFQTPISWLFSSAGMAVGDFNGDGKPDLAISGGGVNGTVYIALGKGDGNFMTAAPYSLGNGLVGGSYPTAVSDVNGDGKLDLVVDVEAANNVAILLGNGDGTFQPAVNYPTNSGGQSFYFAVGDVSGDEKPDIVVNQFVGIGVLLGNGDGTFQTVHSYALPPVPRGVAIGDMNGDGIPDVIAVTNGLTPTTSFAWVLPGKGDGTFGTALSFPVGTAPYTPVLGDFNRDNRLDVVTANDTANSVSVLLNDQPVLVPVTINSLPSGLKVTVDNGAPCSTPCIVNLYSGSSHTIAAASPQFTEPGTQFVFQNWSDSGGQTHLITVPITPVIYTATFKTQFQLTTGDLPFNGGTITPPSGGYYDAGAVVPVQAISAPGYSFVNWSGPVADPRQSVTSVTMDASKSITAFFSPVISQTAGLLFVPLHPCRIADTRNTGGFGGPRLASHEVRSIPVVSSLCGVPPTAAAYALNVTVVPRGPLAYLTLWPAGQTQPLVSTLNSLDGRVKANAAIVAAGTGGAVNVFVTDPADVVLDMNGYFVPSGGATGLAFYPIDPCRIADTRNATGPFGGPTISAGETRTFLPGQSACNIPPTAQAYSLNFTAVPKSSLSFLTTWPFGQSQPFVSTLNSLSGEIIANAAVVPAGTNGGVSVYVTDTSDVVIDVNGYFAPAGALGALSFYTIKPCRLLDTRSPPATLGGPGISAGETRTLPLLSSSCGVSGSAQAYSVNATVVPLVDLSFLTLWPSGQLQPEVSTLNALDGDITSNAAIVPAGPGGVIKAYATNITDLILDISGYFAP